MALRSLPPGRRPAHQACMDFLHRHRRFPGLSLPADAVNTAAGQLPLLIVASRFGAEAAGLLALTLRSLGAPIGLLGAAVLDVFKRRASAAFRERGECRHEYLQTFAVLSLGSLVLAVVVGAASEMLFAFAFGERWRGAGTMALWLMPMFALRFVASPLSYMMYIANQQHVDLAWQLGLLAVTLTTLWWTPSVAAALLAYSAGYSVMYLIYLFLSYRFSLGSRA
jgi:O-antigen/teichoic acid export membrane protein